MSESLPPGGYFLAPRYLAWDDGETLAVLGVPDGDLIELQGELRRGFHEGEVSANLRAASLLDSSLAQLASAMADGAPQPLTRAALLRGAGYEQLFIELTAQCNEHCVHCYAESSPERREALDLETLRAVIDDAASVGFESVQLTGGDPLISAHCLEAARHVREAGIARLEIYTNGLALGGQLYDALRELQPAFAFSFYSSDADEHDAITRTPGSQRRTLEAIRRVAADGLSCRASIVVMEDNRDSVEATVACLGEVGVSPERIGIDVQRSVGRGLLTIRRSEARTATTPIEPVSGDRGPSMAPAAGAGHRAPGSHGFGGRAAVSYDGTVFPCIFTRSWPLGDVRQRRLREILMDGRELSLDRDAIIEGMSRHHDQLSCWECRMRASMLGGDVRDE